MQLLDIDKTLYRQRFKRVSAALAVSLAILALGFSTLLIHFFGHESGAGSNTPLNLAGVLLALAILIGALQKLRHTPYFYEVAYVWTLKHELNLITRKLAKVKAAVEGGDANAMQILHFSYEGSKQLWQLDDNTLVMEELGQWQRELSERAQGCGVTLAVETYTRTLLDAF